MSCRNWNAGGPSCTGSWARSGTSARVAERGAPQVREAELRVRGPLATRVTARSTT